MSMMEERAYQYLVDSKGEGGLVCELDRSPMLDKPTIIIGLGGTGIDAMLHAKYVIQRKIKAPDGKKKPGRLAFIAIDTDENAFKQKRVGDVRVDANEQVLIDEPKIATFMKNPELIPQDYLREWLCRGINADAITYGAGGIRQCGRFMLINKAQNLIQRVSQAAAETWGAGKENGAGFTPDTGYTVYILTGISGGTGSGTFLDVAYLVREIITNQVHKDVEIRGFIFMPDVNLCKVQDAATRAYIPVNGYAALRELDFWMNAERGRNFVQQYTPVVTVNTSAKPFDLCCLVSPNGALDTDYDNCMQTTGEALMNIMTAPENAQAMNFDSYITNLGQMLNTAALKTTYSANYVYTSMGMDEQRLQLDSMANYLAYYLLLRVNALFDREPIKEQVESFFTKDLHLDAKRGLQRLFDKAIPARPFNEVVRNLDDFKRAVEGYKHATVLDNGILESELGTWLASCEATYNQNQRSILEECMNAMKSMLEAKFVDTQFGPYFVHRLLHNVDVGKPDVLKRLDEERNAIAAFRATADDREDKLKQLADEALDAARRNKFVPLISNARYNDYVEAVFRYYDHKRYMKFADIAYQFYTRMLSEVTDYNNRIVERFAQLLEHLTQVFRSNSEIITNVSHDGSTHTWNVGNFDKIRATVDAALVNLKNAGKEEALVSEFLQTMLADRRAWVGDEGGLGESFSRFVSQKFHDLMNQTLEETYMEMYNLAGEAQLQQHMQSVVLPKLRSGAKVLYTPDNVLSPLSNSPERAMIAVPSTATNIVAAVRNYVTANNIPCDVVESTRQGSLFWFQASSGLPMYAHDALRTYQTSHDVYGTVDNHRGRYLKMSAEENWLELLPPLLPEAAWDYAKYKNPKWEKRNAATRALFHEGWKLGLIPELEPGSTVRVLGVVDSEAFREMIERSPMTAEDREKVAAGGAAAAASLKLSADKVKQYVAEAEAFDREGWTPDERVKFKNDVFSKLRGGVLVNRNEGEQRTTQILCENLLWTPDMAMKLAEQVKLKKELRKVIEANKVYLELGDVEKIERENFANALMYGVYRAAAPRVFQLDGSDVGLPTTLLMTITDYRIAPVEDPFYALFRKYVTYDDTLKENMKKICQVRENRMNAEMNVGNTARYNQYLKMVKGIDASMAARLQQIDMDVTFEHKEIREFYVEMRKIFKNFLADAIM